MYIVTGGAGFIGSQVVRDLISQGEHVVVLDNFSTGRRANLAGLPEDQLTIVEANVVDGLWPAMAPIEREHGTASCIIHLAAQVAVVNSVANPLDDVRHNYATTIHVLEYARHKGVPRVVFASSAAAYGDVAEMPVREPMAHSPVSPYGINKLGSEMYLRYYAKVFGLKTVSFRFFNVYGPRQDPANPYSGVISLFIKRALDGRDLTIFGDGSQTRDFVYVGDVARALISGSRRDFVGDVFNVGRGLPTSVLDLAQASIRCCESASDIVHAAPRAGEILHSYADVTAIREQLDFEAKVALDEGLKVTLDWMRSENTPG